MAPVGNFMPFHVSTVPQKFSIKLNFADAIFFWHRCNCYHLGHEYYLLEGLYFDKVLEFHLIRPKKLCNLTGTLHDPTKPVITIRGVYIHVYICIHGS